MFIAGVGPWRLGKKLKKSFASVKGRALGEMAVDNTLVKTIPMSFPDTTTTSTKKPDKAWAEEQALGASAASGNN